MVSVVIVFAWSAILAAQFSATQQIMGSLTGMPPAICSLIALLLIIAHTFFGGQAAIMRIGCIQMVVIFGGLVAVLVWLTRHNSLWFSSVALEPVNSQFPLGKLIHYGLIIGGSYLVCPMLFGRLLSARDSKAARYGGIIAAGGLVCAAVLMVAIGLACKGMLPVDTPTDAVLTTALTTILPDWLNILILLALLSAVVSSVDACLITAGTILSCDLLRTESKAACRVSIVLLGCIGAALSRMDKSIIDFLLMSYDIYVCGIVVPVLIGLIASPICKVDSRFACAAVFTGGVLGGISSFNGVTIWSYIGLAASLVITLSGLRKTANNDALFSASIR
jgi:SSS family solute:Na+ symporter